MTSTKRKAYKYKEERIVKSKWEKDITLHKNEILKARNKIKELDDEIDHQINTCNNHGHLYRISRLEAFKETLGVMFCHKVLSGPDDLQDQLTKHGFFNEKCMTRMFQNGQGVHKYNFTACDLKGDKICSLCGIPHSDCKEWGTLVLWAEPVPRKVDKKRIIQYGWQWKAAYITTEMPNLQVTDFYTIVGTQVPKVCAVKYVWLLWHRYSIECDNILASAVEEQEKAFADPLDEYKSDDE